MSYRQKRAGILSRISSKIEEFRKGKNVAYWDHDIFPGIMFRFPHDLIRRQQVGGPSTYDKLLAYVAMMLPDKKNLVERIFAFSTDLSPVKIKATKEWTELLQALSKNLMQIMVRPGEACLIYWNGQILDVGTEPGIYEIDRSKRIPGIELAFIQTTEIREFMDDSGNVISREGILWGLPYKDGPQVRVSDDPAYEKIKVRIGANGTVILKIKDPEKFFINLVGNRNIQTTNDLATLLKGEIQNAFSRQMASRPYAMIADNYQFLGETIQTDETLNQRLEDYGLEITSVLVKNVTYDPSRKEFIEGILEAALDMEELLEIRKQQKEQRILQQEAEKEKARIGVIEAKAEQTKIEALQSKEELLKQQEFERELRRREIEAQTYQLERQGDAIVEQAKSVGEALRRENEQKAFQQQTQPTMPMQSQPQQAQGQQMPGTQPGQKFCMYCGTQLPLNAQFCFKCGKQQPVM